MKPNREMRLTDMSNKPQDIKYNNQKVVLSLFQHSDTLSVSEITEKVNLSKTTLTKIVGDFFKNGLINSAGKGSSTDEGGKKPELFIFNPNYRYSIALVLYLNAIVGAVLDLKSNIRYNYTMNVSHSLSYEDTIQNMGLVIESMMTGYGLKPDQICGISVGCEGIIDAAQGILYYPIHHSWGRNLNIKEDLHNVLPFEADIYFDNCCRFAGYAELLCEESRNCNSLVTIFSSHSAGGCVIKDHKLVHGTNGFVGEFGHTILDPASDIKCACGGKGCFETLVSQDALISSALKNFGNYPDSIIFNKAKMQSLTIEDVFSAANKGDKFARILLDKIIYYYSIQIHNIMLLHDPEKIILQGIYATAGEYFIDTLKKQVNASPFFKIHRDISIVNSRLDSNTAFLIGGGFYANSQYLNSDSLYACLSNL